MTVTADRAGRLGSLVVAIALAIVQGAVAQAPPPAGAVELVAVSGTGYGYPAVSADGRHVAFVSDLRLVAGDTNSVLDVYVRDHILGTTALISASEDGEVGNGTSVRPSISADGRFVAFSSSASNLVGDDTNGVDDIFVHDRDSEEDGLFDEADRTNVMRVSVDTDGIEANCQSVRPSISANGRYVAFDSCVTNWAEVWGKTLAVHDIFVHDRQRAVTFLVNPPTQNSDTGFNNHHSGDASISADGRYVAFASQATSQPQTLNHFGSSQIYVRDTCLGASDNCEPATEWASPQIHVDFQPSDAFKPSISGDGRSVAFESRSMSMVAGDTNEVMDIFVFDRQSRAVTRVNVSGLGEQALTIGQSTCSGSLHASISGDGRLVTFESCANNLVADDDRPPNFQDVFVHDRDSDGNGTFDEPGGIATELISRNPAGVTADSSSLYPAISIDGNVVAFSSFSRDITPNASPIGVYIWTRANRRPVADAGADQSIVATGPDGAVVTLDGSASHDPDNDSLTFTWTGPFGTETGVTVSPTIGVGTHTATLTVDDGHGGTDSDTVEIIVAAEDGPDLSLAVTAAPNPIEAGQELTYAVVVANEGLADAAGAVVRMPLPAHVNFVRAAHLAGSCSGPAAGVAGTVSCTLDVIDAGATNEFSVVVVPNTAGVLTLSLTVNGSQPDPSPTSNQVEVAVTVRPARAVITVAESIVVTDTPVPMPSALLNVAEIVTVQDSPNVLPSALLGISESIAVTDGIGVLPSALLSVTETVAVLDAVDLAPSGNTSPGTNVLVTPVDAATGRAPVKLTFETVISPGHTVLKIDVDGPPPPSGFVEGNPRQFYELSTTAAVAGNIEVCVAYAGTTFDAVPTLWHFENTAWVHITTRHDTARHEVCGNSRSLSPFALFAPSNLGIPSIRSRLAASGRDANGRFYVDVTLSNIGTGHARKVRIARLNFLTLAGKGAVTYDARRSGPLPLEVGSLDVGASAPLRLYLKVPKSVQLFFILESGALETVTGTHRHVLTAQVIDAR